MEEIKDITEHQLEVGEIGIYKGLTYIAVDNSSSECLMCTECNIVGDCSTVLCDTFGIYFKRHIISKKEDIDPILESIDDASNDGSDPIEMITITKSEYADLLRNSKYYFMERSRLNPEDNKIKNIVSGLNNKLNNLKYW